MRIPCIQTDSRLSQYSRRPITKGIPEYMYTSENIKGYRDASHMIDNILSEVMPLWEFGGGDAEFGWQHL